MPELPLPNLLEFDRLTSVPMALHAVLTALALLASPRRDLSGKAVGGTVLILAGSCLASCSGSLAVCALGWTIATAPFFLRMFDRALPFQAKGLLAAGCASLAGASAAAASGGPEWLSFSLLTLAALLRKGLFPFHSWVANSFETGPLIPLTLLFNGHLGAMALVRFGPTLFPEVSKEAATLVCGMALLTAIYSAVLAIAEQSTRRILALLAVSQASFILAGFQSRSPEGISGAAVHWLVVSTAVTGLGLAYRLAEIRCAHAARPAGHLGLAMRMPRLAVFFALCGLALVGLPGTLGFVAEDLLFHGAIESHPVIGLALPIATALNAITFLRLFSKLFLGRRESAVPGVPDARLTERLALTVCIGLLVLGGLFPQVAISARQEASRAIANAMATQPAPD